MFSQPSQLTTCWYVSLQQVRQSTSFGHIQISRARKLFCRQICGAHVTSGELSRASRYMVLGSKMPKIPNMCMNLSEQVFESVECADSIALSSDTSASFSPVRRSEFWFWDQMVLTFEFSGWFHCGRVLIMLDTSLSNYSRCINSLTGSALQHVVNVSVTPTSTSLSFVKASFIACFRAIGTGIPPIPLLHATGESTRESTGERLLNFYCKVAKPLFLCLDWKLLRLHY